MEATVSLPYSFCLFFFKLLTQNKQAGKELLTCILVPGQGLKILELAANIFIGWIWQPQYPQNRFLLGSS